ncbi:MAG: tetratricopeptide repeat protein [Candidatus Zixiibacteriota bacterium]
MPCVLITSAEKEQQSKQTDLHISLKYQQGEANQKAYLARKLMRQRNYEAASALFEELYEQDRDNPSIMNQLLSCYEQLGYVVKAEELARRFVEHHPQNVTYRVKLAEVLVKQGRMEDAEASYREAILLLQQGSISTYQMVLRSLQKHSFETTALALIDTVRLKRHDSTLFALERGTILEQQNRYRDAALEFFAVLDDTGRRVNDAENRLLSLLEFPESSAEVEQALLEQTGRTVNSSAAKILTTFYLQTEQFDRALDFVVLRDSLEGQTGRPLVNFLRSCRERKQYQQAARIAEYILSRYQGQPILGETYFLYADVLVQLGRYEEAIAMYDSLFVLSPRTQDKAEALYLIGNIYLNHLHDYSQALSIFDSVVNYYQAGVGYLNAKLSIPYCYLRQGKLDEARTGFEKVLQGPLNESIQEEVEYHLALLLFFEKKFDSTKTALRKLLVDHPRGFYVNDAVQLLMVLEEATGASELLYDFSNALLFRQRHMLDSVEAKLLLIVHNWNKSLADVALYKLALLSIERADSAKAAEYVDQLAAEFPESYYLPYGLKTKADMLMTQPDGVQEARTIYHHLLEHYPNYPFISEVREKMRQLEGEA